MSSDAAKNAYPLDPRVSDAVTLHVVERQREAYDRGAREASAAAWDACLDAIEENEINTEQARAGNPYRNERDGNVK